MKILSDVSVGPRKNLWRFGGNRIQCLCFRSLHPVQLRSAIPSVATSGAKAPLCRGMWELMLSSESLSTVDSGHYDVKGDTPIAFLFLIFSCASCVIQCVIFCFKTSLWYSSSCCSRLICRRLRQIHIRGYLAHNVWIWIWIWNSQKITNIMCHMQHFLHRMWYCSCKISQNWMKQNPQKQVHKAGSR